MTCPHRSGSASPETPREDAERRLADLAEAVAARDNFIAVAAHELRNPMTPMIGQVELLLKGLDTGKYSLEDIRARLERIHRSMGRHLKRAATLLDVARITSGKFKVVPAPCDLGEIIHFVAETFDDTARHAGARLEIDAPTRVPGCWDRLALEPPMDDLLDAYRARLLESVRLRKVTRSFIDGLGAFQIAAASSDPTRMSMFLTALMNEMRVLGVTTIYTLEVPDIMGPSIRTSLGDLSSLAENLVLLRFVEVGAQLHRLISVLKVRDSQFNQSCTNIARAVTGWSSRPARIASRG